MTRLWRIKCRSGATLKIRAETYAEARTIAARRHREFNPESVSLIETPEERARQVEAVIAAYMKSM